MDLSVKRLSEIIRCAQDMLKAAGVADYEYDSWLLSEYVFGIDRQKYYMNPSAEPDDKKIKLYFDLVDIRKMGRPLHYITGKCNFMGFTFKTHENVLIPRQDTEVLADYTIRQINRICKDKNIIPQQMGVLDMCTGSGCIGISIAKITGVNVTCADISGDAIDCARTNAENLGVSNTEIIRSDLFADIKDSFDIIVSNPPYIASGDIAGLMSEVKDYEPILALDGSEDGLEFYRNITGEAGTHLNKGGIIIYEIGCDQAADVSAILSQNNFTDIEIIKDLAGLDRVVKAGKE